VIGKCQSSVMTYDGRRLQIHYFLLRLSGFIVLRVKFIFVLWIFCLVSFNELTFPDSQDWLSVMKLASIRQGGKRRETGMETECVWREVNFSDVLYRIAEAAATQARIDICPYCFSEIMGVTAFLCKIAQLWYKDNFGAVE